MILLFQNHPYPSVTCNRCVAQCCCGNHLSQGQMISLTSKPQSGSIMWEFTRELNKESLLN